MIRSGCLYFLVICIISGLSLPSNYAQDIDLSSSSIYLTSQSRDQLTKVVEVLQEEVDRRTGIEWPLSEELGGDGTPQVILSFEDEVGALPPEVIDEVNGLNAIDREGFKLLVNPEFKESHHCLSV